MLNYVLRRIAIAIPTILLLVVISFVLTRGAEESLRQAMLISDNGPLIFLERPFAIGCFAVTVTLLYLRLRRRR